MGRGPQPRRSPAMVSLSDIVTILSPSSSVVLILGAIFIVFQMHQNARFIEATLKQGRAAVAVSRLERITEEAFPRRRKRMFEILERFQATNLADAFESEEDLEVRDLACLDELVEFLVGDRLVDLELVPDALQYPVVRDRERFAPYATLVKSQSRVPFNAWGRFEWLAREARAHLARERATPNATLGVGVGA